MGIVPLAVRGDLGNLAEGGFFLRADLAGGDRSGQHLVELGEVFGRLAIADGVEGFGEVVAGALERGVVVAGGEG